MPLRHSRGSTLRLHMLQTYLAVSVWLLSAVSRVPFHLHLLQNTTAHKHIKLGTRTHSCSLSSTYNSVVNIMLRARSALLLASSPKIMFHVELKGKARVQSCSLRHGWHQLKLGARVHSCSHLQQACLFLSNCGWARLHALHVVQSFSLHHITVYIRQKQRQEYTFCSPRNLCLFVSWYFEPSQPLAIISGLNGIPACHHGSVRATIYPQYWNPWQTHKGDLIKTYKVFSISSASANSHADLLWQSNCTLHECM